MAGCTALVTGASGFIGSHLCQRLVQIGATIHTVSRQHHTGAVPGWCWWQGDLADLATVRDILHRSKPDVVFHLASHVSGAREREAVLPTFHSNLMSTVNLLTVASEIGCRRFILAGSMEEPDATTPDAVPCSPYAAAKWAGSAYARMFHALYQLPVVILRIFMVYGPAQRDLRKLIPYVTLSLLRGEPPRLSSGQRQVDWIYIDDVVDGILAAAQAPAIEGGTLEIGSGTLVSVRAVVEQLVDLITPGGAVPFGALPERPLEQVRVAGTAATYAKLGWQPTTPLPAGLHRTVAWYAQQLRDATL
jgi:nucleoside-diphosphate-sugar epimerase